ncbi:MAG: LamB/YcsF family protein [Lachnospiraceae bacterium]|nr:LamB/YcsF family protein [Lachnospiraceae bacterium]
MVKVDLNSDIGESFGRYTLGMDDKIIPLVSSCNIACGYHAADPMVMKKTVQMAKDAGIAIGAHPGFPDLMGFGRRNMVVTPEEGAAYVTYQIGALDAFAKSIGMKMQHVKPHGALYNMAGKDYDLALAIAKAIQAYNPELICLALAGSQSVKAARDIGLPVAQEVFADRAYMPDGSLVPRSRPDSMVTDEELAIERVVRMVKEHKVTAVDGQDIEIIPDSICVHGDGVKALAFVSRIRSRLEAEGVTIAPIWDVIK